MTAFTLPAHQILSQCEQLASLSQSPTGIDRRYLTSQHAAANQLLSRWMVEAGLDCWQDEVGNQWGRLKSASPEAKSLIFGSHIDSVPNAGRYDGILGILLPLALAKHCKEQSLALPFDLEIVAFGDEEGSRFKTTLMGSLAVAGHWQDKWALLRDGDNICLAQAMRDFGLDINNAKRAARTPNTILGFIECHIEQGPVLEAADSPVGVVSAISGASRFEITVGGDAGHAGTVPMDMRKDALAGCAEMILAVESIAKTLEVVATVGRIEARPNAVNVICGESVFTLDVRSQNDALRTQAIAEIQGALERIAASRQLTLELRKTHEADAVNCDQVLTDNLLNACRKAGYAPISLPSGAGHDAMAMARLCPMGMLFVRCEKGISHHPAEAITAGDVEAALRVMNGVLLQLQGQNEVALQTAV